MRLTKEQRQSVILRTGVDIANKDGLTFATFESISDQCDPSTSIGTIRFYYRSRGDLWAAIASHERAGASVREKARRLGLIS